MSVKFLGQFLIQRGAIDAEQLRQALELMERTYASLGELAVKAGYLSEEEVERFREEEQATGEAFAALLCESPRIDAQQLDELFRQQTNGRLRLGEALVRLGFLEAAQLAELIQAFDQDQAPYRVGPAALPPELSQHRPANVIVALFPSIMWSYTSVHLKIVRAEARPAGVEVPYRSSVLTRGSSPLRVELGASEELARAIARGVLGEASFRPDPQLLAESLGELLNVVVGNALALLETAGVHLSLFPPDHGQAHERGAAFDLVTPHGNGVLYLDPDPPAPQGGLELS